MSFKSNSLVTIAAAVICSVIAVALIDTKASHQDAAQNSNAAFDRVMSTHTIRCSYVPYAPANIVDPNTKAMTGVLHDVAEEMGKVLDLKVKWVEESTWGTFIETVRGGRADAFCGAAFGFAAELKNAELVGPVYYSGITVWTRANDHRFDGGLAALNQKGVTITGEDGSVASQLAAALAPNAKLLALPQNAPYSMKMDNVAQGKADATFVESYVGEDYLAHNPGTIRNVTTGAPVAVYPNVFIVNKGEFKLQSMLQGAMNILHNNGTIERIMKKYEIYPHTLLRVRRPYEE